MTKPSRVCFGLTSRLIVAASVYFNAGQGKVGVPAIKTYRVNAMHQSAFLAQAIL